MEDANGNMKPHKPSKVPSKEQILKMGNKDRVLRAHARKKKNNWSEMHDQRTKKRKSRVCDRTTKWGTTPSRKKKEHTALTRDSVNMRKQAANHCHEPKKRGEPGRTESE